jgi:hypothetical protein
LVLKQILSDPYVYQENQKTYVMFFKALNETTFSFYKSITNINSKEFELKTLQIFCNLLEVHHSLFELVTQDLLLDQRTKRIFRIFKKIFPKVFTEHSIKGFSDPLKHFLGITLRKLIPFKIVSFICKTFLKICTSFDSGQETSDGVLKSLLVCKLHFQKFLSFYLSVFPNKRSSVLSDFLTFSESNPSSVGLAFFNETIQRASTKIKKRKMEHYMACYSQIKNHSRFLDSIQI